MSWLIAICILTVGVLNYLGTRDAVHPSVVQALVWCACVSLLAAHGGEFLEVDQGVWLLVLAGVVSFSLGAHVVRQGPPLRVSRGPVSDTKAISLPLVVLVTTVVGVGAALYLRDARSVALAGPSESAAVNLRLSRWAMEDLRQGTLLDFWERVVVVSYAWTLFLLANAVRGHAVERQPARRALLALNVAMALVLGVATTGRGILMMFVLGVLTVFLVRSRFAALYAIAGALITFGVFLVGGVVLGKGVEESGSTTELVSQAWGTFSVYGAAGLPALTAFTEHLPELEYGRHTFRTLLAVLAALGFDVDVPSLVREFVFVPYPTNVYTVYEPYLRDFGWGGAIAVQALFGALHSALYARAKQGHPAWMTLFALSMYALLFQVFADAYFSILSTWIQAAAYCIAFGALQKTLTHSGQYAGIEPGPRRAPGIGVL